MRRLTKAALAMQFIDFCEIVPLKDASIKEFAEFAGISKQTFYNYFLDKADLMNYAYEIGSQKIVEDMRGSVSSLRDGAVRMAQVCLRNKKFYTQLARYETQNNFIQHFTHRCELVYQEKLAALHGAQIIDNRMRRIIHVYSVGVCTYFVEWIRSDMKDPPEYIADIIVSCLPLCIRKLLEPEDD